MDVDRFDAVLRALSSSPSRRHALRLLASTVVVGLPVAGTRSVDAKGGKKGKGKGKGCPKGKKKCGKKCIAQESCCTFVDCTGCSHERACVNGKCQCDPELIMHNGKCGFFINCQGFGEPCTSGGVDCCGNCVFDVDAGESRCSKSIHDCITDNDCLSGPCIGFLCPEANKPFFDLCRQ
jgi:hypothetical protein